jgi:hypothetical protein
MPVLQAASADFIQNFKTSAQPAETFTNETLFCIQDGQETEKEIM